MSDDADDHNDARDRSLLGPAFWASLVLAAACIAGGIAVVLTWGHAG